ncbi:hypothetical protein D3C81_944430 [compost metagenome]
MDAQCIGAGLALAVVFAPAAQGGQQLAVAVFGNDLAQRIEQFVEGVVVAVAPEHHRQPIAVERQQSGARQHFAPVGQQVTDPAIAATQSGKSIGLPTHGNAQDVPAQAVEFVQQALVLDRLARRPAPEQRGFGRAHAPTVRMTARQPGTQCLDGLSWCVLQAQFEQVRHSSHLWFEAQLLRFIDQSWRIPGFAQQQRQQVIAALAPPLLFGLLVALAHQHFGGHAHQFGVGAQLLGFAGDAQHADQALVEHQWQVDARLYALEMNRRLRIDLHHPAIGQYQLRALMPGVDPLRFAAAQDQALAVHDVDVVRQDSHRPVDDVLGQVVIEFEHASDP